MAVNLFDANYYRKANTDLAGSDTQLQQHFQQYGLNEGRSFSPFADLNFYRASNSKDLANFSNQQAYDHLQQFGIAEGRTFSRFADLNFYKSANSDLAGKLSKGENLEGYFEHLQQYGSAEGRTFSPFFKPDYYRSANTDLPSLNNRQLLEHLEQYGLGEGRNFAANFDAKYYRNANSDLAAAGFDNKQLYNHFRLYGIAESRESSPIFSVKSYLQDANNADLRSLNPTQAHEHFNLYGYQEGRFGCADYAGNTLGSARAIDLSSNNVTFKDFVGANDTDDYYRFTLTKPASGSVTLDGLGANANVEMIADANNNGIVDDNEVIKSSNNSATNKDVFSGILNPGTYYIRVNRSETANTSYQLKLSTTDKLPNNAPVVAALTARGNEDTEIKLNLVGSDVDKDTLTITADETSLNGGTIAKSEDGSFTYKPKADYNGTDELSYTVDDGKGGTASEKVTITVNPVNDNPVVAALTARGDEDTEIKLNLVGDDVDEDSLTVTADATSKNGGTITKNEDGSFTYKAAANFNGTDEFNYTVSDGKDGTASEKVTITVNPVNDLPVVTALTQSGNEDTEIKLNLEGDDVDEDSLTVTADATSKNGGTITKNEDGSFTYKPKADYNGTDELSYTVDDGKGGTASEKVTITVNPVNDNPVVAALTARGDEDTEIKLNLVGSDVDKDTLTITADATSKNGGTIAKSEDGSFTYKPKADYNGTDELSYTVDDGKGGTASEKVTITVNPVNDNPVVAALTARGDEDTEIKLNLVGDDVDEDSLTVTADATSKNGGTITKNEDGSFTYKAAANFNGTDEFNYTVSDGKDGTASEKVTITVNPVNDLPVVTALTQSGNEDTEIKLNLEGDDVDEDSLTVTADATSKNGGTITKNEDGSFTYKPKADYNGTDELSYTVDDGKGGTASEKVTITVNSVNDAPVVAYTTASSVNFEEGDPAVAIIDTAKLTINDVDNDNLQTATVEISSPQSGDTLAIDPSALTDTDISVDTVNSTTSKLVLTGEASFDQYKDVLGSVTYNNNSQNPNETERSITLSVNDGEDDSEIATSTVAVSAVNDPPVVDLNGSKTGKDYTTNFNIGRGAVAVVDKDNLVSSDDQDSLASATVKIVNQINSDDEVLTANTVGTNIKASYNPATDTLSLEGTDNAEHYQKVLRSVTYNNKSVNPTTTERKIQFTINDGEVDSEIATSTVNVNNSSVLDLNGSGEGIDYTAASFAEDGGAVAIVDSDDLSVTDANNSKLKSASIKIDNVKADDVLKATTDGTSITANYNSTTGELSLSGDDTLGNYENVLRSVTYNNTSQNPNTTARTIKFTINDGITDSEIATSTVSVTAINDTPAIDLNGSVGGKDYTASFTEDGQPVAIVDKDNLSITDDDTQIKSATVKINNLKNGSDEVLAATTIGNIKIAANSPAGTLTLEGDGTLAEYQTVLRSVTYDNKSQNPDTTARQIQFTINDGTIDSDIATSTVSVTAVNDAPVVDLDSSVAGKDYSKAIFSTGRGAVPIVDKDKLSISDDDNAQLTSATVKIDFPINTSSEKLEAITTDTNITAKYSSGTLTLEGVADVADYQKVLGSVTYNNTSPNPTTTAREIKFTINDGKDISEVATSTVSINPPPAVDLNGSATGKDYSSATFTEDGQPVKVVATSLTVTDANNNQLKSATVKINNLKNGINEVLDTTINSGIPISKSYDPNTGILTLTANGPATLANYQDVLRSVTYSNTSQNPDTTAREIQFTLNDGITVSDVATSTVAVNAVNDAPVVAVNNTTNPSFTEDGSPAVVAANLSVNDVDNTQIQTATIKINNLLNVNNEVLDTTINSGIPISKSYDPNTGILTLTANGPATLANYQDVLRSVTYSNTSQNPDTTAREIQFTLNDGITVSDVATSTVAVNAVNDAPVVAVNNTTNPSFTEDGSPAVVAANLSVNDVDNTQIKGATVKINNRQNGSDEVLAATTIGSITSSYNSGTLTLEGDGTLADYQAVLRSVTYDNKSQNPGTATRQIQFTINDGTINSNIATSTVNVIAVNDAPIMPTNSPKFISGSGTHSLTNTNLLATDPDNTPGALTYKIVSKPQNGTVRLPNPIFGGTYDVTDVNSTFTQADINNGRLTYRSTNGNNDSFTFQISDGLGKTNDQIFTFNISKVV